MNDDMLPPAGTSPVPLSQLKDNAMKYGRCTLDPNELAELRATCDKIEKLEKEFGLYSGIEAETGLERWLAAGIHYRESDCSMLGCFANGDRVVGPDAMRLNKKTTNVPAGKGPWPTVLASAIWAINDELKTKGWKHAPIGMADSLAFCERYNGLGPRNHGIDSGYIWGGTSEEDLGGYSNDGAWNARRVETRLGVVAIEKEMRRRELSEPAEPTPIPDVPTDLDVYDKLLKLADVKPVKELIEFHKKTMPTKKLRHWAFVDFSKPSTEKRLYLLDTVGMSVTKYLCSHGAGSDPNNDGWADKFSNVDGSHMSSLGIVRCSELYQSRGETRMRFDGLEPSCSNVRARAIVMHSASYVNEARGTCGRSWGCTAVDAKRLPHLVEALHGGSLLNLWRE